MLHRLDNTYRDDIDKCFRWRLYRNLLFISYVIFPIGFVDRSRRLKRRSLIHDMSLVRRIEQLSVCAHGVDRQKVMRRMTIYSISEEEIMVYHNDTYLWKCRSLKKICLFAWLSFRNSRTAIAESYEGPACLAGVRWNFLGAGDGSGNNSLSLSWGVFMVNDLVYSEATYWLQNALYNSGFLYSYALLRDITVVIHAMRSASKEQSHVSDSIANRYQSMCPHDRLCQVNASPVAPKGADSLSTEVSNEQ